MQVARLSLDVSSKAKSLSQQLVEKLSLDVNSKVKSWCK